MATQAYDSLQVMIRQSTFPNLMDTHPPGLFQIDGNLGAANGMLEALVQSRWMPEAAEIELLPALPQQWAEGSVEGLSRAWRRRGGHALEGREGEIAWNCTRPPMARCGPIPPVGQTMLGGDTAAGQAIPFGTQGVIRIDQWYVVSRGFH